MTLLHGDCLSLLKEIEPGSVDLVLTDPPYGIDFQSVWKKDKSKRFPKIKNDKSSFVNCIPFIKPLLSDRGGGISLYQMGCTAGIY